ncbi:MAG: TolC family protein, partial [Candidatus Omnitrophota bacterium]
MKRYICIQLFILFLVLIIIALNEAQAEDSFTWGDCVKEAIANHPDLISAAENVKQARSDKDIDLSSMLPDVTGEISGKKSKTGGKKA